MDLCSILMVRHFQTSQFLMPVSASFRIIHLKQISIDNIGRSLYMSTINYIVRTLYMNLQSNFSQCVL